ncbi:MAG: methylated-DNA--protein-cysteine S-methyltransferase [Solirubrobacterales bacterium]|nr:methylated-DNA--protein-cysteine S-methyltransferase [Solirubrobacterales bacterium]
MLALADRRGRISGLYFIDGRMTPAAGPTWVHDEEPFRQLRWQLGAYFAGQLTRFDLPVAGCGTEYQERVWAAVEEVPYGATISYGALARRLGNPRAARAVGLANAHNPISIIVPCHRVIGSSGALVGYAGGRERKQWLLAHETKRTARRDRSTTNETVASAHARTTTSERNQ